MRARTHAALHAFRLRSHDRRASDAFPVPLHTAMCTHPLAAMAVLFLMTASCLVSRGTLEGRMLRAAAPADRAHPPSAQRELAVDAMMLRSFPDDPARHLRGHGAPHSAPLTAVADALPIPRPFPPPRKGPPAPGADFLRTRAGRRLAVAGGRHAFSGHTRRSVAATAAFPAPVTWVRPVLSGDTNDRQRRVARAIAQHGNRQRSSSRASAGPSGICTRGVSDRDGLGVRADGIPARK